MTNRSRAALNPLFNLLASGFLVLSCLCMCAVATVFAAPGVVPAQFRPVDIPTEVAALDLSLPPTNIPTPSDTPGPAVPTFPPTWTAEAVQPTDTITPSPTNTLPGDTGTPSAPTKTLSPRPYTLQQGSPTYLPNYINTAECNFMGIIGQAFNLAGTAELNLYVHLEGGGLSTDGVTGSESSSIAPGAYKIPLGDHPVTTTGTYQLQLRNASGQPLSDVYPIDTFGDCNKNLIIVNFEQNH